MEETLSKESIKNSLEAINFIAKILDEWHFQAKDIQKAYIAINFIKAARTEMEKRFLELEGAHE